MKKIPPLVLCLFFVNFSFSQDSLSSALVKRYTYQLEIVNGAFRGEGWDSLRKDIEASQFVLLGENHSSPKLSELTAVLLTEMKPFGYRHFIIETGPVASEKVKQLYNKDLNIYKKNLHDFLSAYKLELGSPPAEFIAMPTDPLMYHSAINNGYQIKGIDKEYMSGSQYLFAELLQYCTSASLKQQHRLVVQQLSYYDKQVLADEDFTHSIHCREDSVIQHFLQAVSLSPKAKFIAEQINKSWEIYGLYEAKQYYRSESKRIALFKKNFGEYYHAHQQQPFKALIKYGNLHTGRGESLTGYLDLGNMISELAALNGARSLHIQGMRRYRYNDKDSTILDFANAGYSIYPHIISMAEKDNWVLVNLQPLRELYKTGKLKAAKDEGLLITKNDWVLLTPVDVAYSRSFNYE